MPEQLTRRQTRTIPPPGGGRKRPTADRAIRLAAVFFCPDAKMAAGAEKKKGEMKEERGKRKRIRLKKWRREKERQKETVSPRPASSGDAGLGRGSRRSGQGLDGQLYARLDARRLTVAQGERAAQARERGARELHAHAQPRGLFRIHGVRPRFAELIVAQGARGVDDRDAPIQGLTNTLQGSSINTIRHMVARGLGISVMPATALTENDHMLFSIIPFELPAPTRRVILASRTQYIRPRAVQVIKEAIPDSKIVGVRFLDEEGASIKPAKK